MKYLIAIFLAFVAFELAFATNNVTVQSGKVSITGGYVDIGTTVLPSTGTVTENAGMCQGLLCALTQN